ncbi:MAG TPA: homoserine O-acetyltransferase, partial [Cyclobacteriaceae bacterium]
FHYPVEFQLESGAKLPGFQLKYTTLGQLNKERDNVVWVCHALTGSSDFADWWHGLFSDGSPFDPNKYFIICANSLGGCYGSTGPLSINPISGTPWFHEFPLITNRDIVQAFDRLRENLGITKVHSLIGGSLGGQQVLEWAIQKPEAFGRIIPVACNAIHSPWGIAFNEAQRMSIAADHTWTTKDARAGSEGMKAARAIGMLSFRSYEIYNKNQPEVASEKLEGYRAASYQNYQGTKLANRFNAFSYWTLLNAMDSHHVGRGRASAEGALSTIKAKALIIGVNSDILFPVSEQKFIADNIPGAQYEVVDSLYGHDGFLVEFEQFREKIRKFLTVKENILL